MILRISRSIRAGAITTLRTNLNSLKTSKIIVAAMSAAIRSFKSAMSFIINMISGIAKAMAVRITKIIMIIITLTIKITMTIRIDWGHYEYDCYDFCNY